INLPQNISHFGLDIGLSAQFLSNAVCRIVENLMEQLRVTPQSYRRVYALKHILEEQSDLFATGCLGSGDFRLTVGTRGLMIGLHESNRRRSEAHQNGPDGGNPN